MNRFRSCLIAGVAAMLLLGTARIASAQINIQIGPPPVCPYGYYDYPPYNCAPYGYYGPEWFDHGIFIGAGPWFHGHNGYWGHVDRHFDPRFGYRGPFPHRGDRPDERHRVDRMQHFHGNEMRDGRGHTGGRGEHHR